MFDALESEIERRLSQTKDMVISLNKLSSDTEFTNFLKTQKGLLFVLFYASIEFTVTNKYQLKSKHVFITKTL